MEDKLLSSSHDSTPSDKNPTLTQLILVISSGVLSSSVVATLVKAWLDNRKTKLTVQINGNTKKLEYEGHHLSEDSATIQAVLAQLKDDIPIVNASTTVSIDAATDPPKQEYLLTPADPQPILDTNNSPPAALPSPSLIHRLLPRRRSRQSS